MTNRNRIYPKSLKIIADNECSEVVYKDSKHEYDIWAIARFLIESKRLPVKLNLNVSDKLSSFEYKSLCLRHYYLKNILENVDVYINGSKSFITEAEEFIDYVNNGAYITYSNNSKGPKVNSRGTKNKLESIVEEAIASSEKWPWSGFRLMYRQWPANVFLKKVAERREDGNNNLLYGRLTRKRWIDIVAIDNCNRLSAIEIKSGDNLPLDLFIQNFDYMVYLHLFKKHIVTEFFPSHQEVMTRPICGYYVVENMHYMISDVLFSNIQKTENFLFMQIKYTGMGDVLPDGISPVGA